MSGGTQPVGGGPQLCRSDSQRGDFAIDLSQAAFCRADAILVVSDLGDSLGGTRQAGDRWQFGFASSQLLLEGRAFLVEPGNAVSR